VAESVLRTYLEDKIWSEMGTFVFSIHRSGKASHLCLETNFRNGAICRLALYMTDTLNFLQVDCPGEATNGHLCCNIQPQKYPPFPE
jgi:hypothetical protein